MSSDLELSLFCPPTSLVILDNVYSNSNNYCSYLQSGNDDSYLHRVIVIIILICLCKVGCLIKLEATAERQIGSYLGVRKLLK